MDGQRMEVSPTATLSALPFTSQAEYEGMIDYFLNGGDAFLRAMGVNPAKVRSREAWLAHVIEDHERADDARIRSYVGWYYDGVHVGHSSVNAITIGSHANIHLHLWRPELRRAGVGMRFFRTSVNYFMGRFKLQRLACEPFAENPAPNRVLTKLGFRFVRRYHAEPSEYSDAQDMNLYELDHLLV